MGFRVAVKWLKATSISRELRHFQPEVPEGALLGKSPLLPGSAVVSGSCSSHVLLGESNKCAQPALLLQMRGSRSPVGCGGKRFLLRGIRGGRHQPQEFKVVALNPSRFPFIHDPKLLFPSADSLTLSVASCCLIAMGVKGKGHHGCLLWLSCLGFWFFPYFPMPRISSVTYKPQNWPRAKHLCFFAIPTFAIPWCLLPWSPSFYLGRKNCPVSTSACPLDCPLVRTPMAVMSAGTC